MISPHELHIGNWIKDPGGYSIQVLAIQRYSIEESGRGMGEEGWFINGHPYTECHPLALTPEILANGFGFVVDSDERFDTYVGSDPFYPIVVFNMDCTYAGRQMKAGDITAGDMEWPPTVRYIHELQNTYYWQTRKLLHRKPKT